MGLWPSITPELGRRQGLPPLSGGRDEDRAATCPPSTPIPVEKSTVLAPRVLAFKKDHFFPVRA